MRNFNTVREIDLRGYLPGVLRDAAEMRAVMDAETPAVAALWQACEDCLNDQFIAEATERGIARRERMLGIAPLATDTLDDRRFRLNARYNEHIPYTKKGLDVLLASLCGEDGYTLKILTGEFTVIVKVALAAKKQEAVVNEMLERVLPYNMVFSVELLYNKWSALSPYKWSALAAKKWKDLKEEVLS